MGMTKKKRLAIIGGTVIGTLAIAAAGVAVANATEAGSRAGSIVAGITGAGHGHGPDGKGPHRPMEEMLTGDDATKVEAAVTAAYPDATIHRMEKDADGSATFEAHITKADGTHATVFLDDNYAITGEAAGGPGHGRGHGGPGHGHDGKGPDRPMEEMLTGDDATKVEAAVTAAYPDATIHRMEKDADGSATFEAHITKADGTHATVFLDDNYAITGETAGGPGHGPGHGPDGMGPGHRGHHDGDGDAPVDGDSTADADGAGAGA